MIELAQILPGLVQRTTEVKLKWYRSVQKNQFVTSVDAISILVGKIEEDRDNTLYRLDIFDESGEEIYSLRDQGTWEEQDRQLALLYEEARQSARNNIDSTLEKLAKALELVGGFSLLVRIPFPSIGLEGG